MSAGTRWILAIVGLLVGNIVAMGVLMGAARSSHPQVIPNYYEKSAHYNDQIEQTAKNRALGWTVSPRWNGSAVTADVTGPDGKVLEGAKIAIVSLPRTAGQTRGLHDVTVTVTRGADVFVQQAVVDAK